MFVKVLTQAGHTRRYAVRQNEQGWEVSVEQDSTVIRRVLYQDWHRVERALATLASQVSELEARGWRESVRA